MLEKYRKREALTIANGSGSSRKFVLPEGANLFLLIIEANGLHLDADGDYYRICASNREGDNNIKAATTFLTDQVYCQLVTSGMSHYNARTEYNLSWYLIQKEPIWVYIKNDTGAEVNFAITLIWEVEIND